MANERTMLITGASRGIGAATARLAAARGWAVAVNYRTQPDEAEALAEALRAGGAEASAFAADLGDEHQIVAMFEAVDRALPPLGCLVNNAGRPAPRRMRLCDLDAAEINGLLAVNVTGAILAAREAVRRMSGREGGSVVNVSSLAARHGAPGLWVHYAASKAALDTFTLGLAKEIAGSGVRVNGVRPGMIDTEIHARSGMSGRVAAAGPKLPLGRAGTAEEVAAAILWLASEEASYVHGAILEVGGGA